MTFATPVTGVGRGGGAPPRRLVWGLTALGLLAAGSAWSGESGGLEQKAALLDRILKDSDTARRSEDKKEAHALLEKAQGLRDQAQVARKAGQEAETRKLLDEALQLAMQASRKTVDPSSQVWREKARYEDLTTGIASFSDAYRRNLERVKSAQPAAAPANPLDLEAVAAELAQGKQLAQAGQFVEANKRLAPVHDALVAGLKGMLHDKTVVVKLEFASPKEEYDYEVNRNNGYQALLRMTLDQGGVKPEAKETVQKMVMASEQSRGDAERQAAAGDHAVALKTMEQANAQMVKALQMAGVQIF
ncbi:MAG: hypothetical protein HQL51_03805 [Magnetococcales bacterium]|nr:hypothetical protein [Magnetococcales bacterium]